MEIIDGDFQVHCILKWKQCYFLKSHDSFSIFLQFVLYCAFVDVMWPKRSPKMKKRLPLYCLKTMVDGK
jgi:hypothetical protein